MCFLVYFKRIYIGDYNITKANDYEILGVAHSSGGIIELIQEWFNTHNYALRDDERTQNLLLALVIKINSHTISDSIQIRSDETPIDAMDYINIMKVKDVDGKY